MNNMADEKMEEDFELIVFRKSPNFYIVSAKNSQ